MRAARFAMAVLVAMTLAGCSVSRAGSPAQTTSTERATTSDEPSDGEDESPKPNDEPVTNNAADCADGTCRLAVSGPATIPIDPTRYHYTVLNVVAVTPNSVRCQVPFEGGGGTDLTVEVGGSSAIGFQELPSISITLETVVNGIAILNLTPGDPL